MIDCTKLAAGDLLRINTKALMFIGRHDDIVFFLSLGFFSPGVVSDIPVGSLTYKFITRYADIIS